MTETIPAVVPQEVVAGDRVWFERYYSTYPATDYGAEWIVPGLGTFEATADGDDFQFQVLGSVTTSWAAGTYKWWIRVTDTSASPTESIKTVQEGAFEVTADPASASAQSGELSDVITAISNLEAVLNGRASQDQKKYKIADRELERLEISELLKLLSYYRGRRRTLESELGMTGKSGRVLARFTVPD